MRDAPEGFSQGFLAVRNPPEDFSQEFLAIRNAPEDFSQGLLAVKKAPEDPHLRHRAHGVLCHAFLARGNLFWAGKTLEGIRESALACCPACRSDFFQRQGYLLGEDWLAAESLEALNRALEEGGRQLSDDARARITFARSIAHHFLGNRDLALRDARATLMGLSLDSPLATFTTPAPSSRSSSSAATPSTTTTPKRPSGDSPSASKAPETGLKCALAPPGPALT